MALVEYKNYSDQQLVDLYGQSRDRDALFELYERYRVSIGDFLYRDIKNKTVVIDAFNNMMRRLVKKGVYPTVENKRISPDNVSTKLFSMAYAFRLKYNDDVTSNHFQPKSISKRRDATALETKLAHLPRQHRDVLELLYKFNFTFDETAEILDCSVLAVRNCLVEIKQYNLVA